MSQNFPDVGDVVSTANKLFKNHFKVDPSTTVFAPGRVNLIGEHTDYNEGFVMPMALPLATVVVGRRVAGNTVSIVTANAKEVDAPEHVSFDIRSVAAGSPKWANYVKGVIANYSGMEPPLPAFQAAIATSVPIGGGLASSAALEVATYVFLDAICNPSQSVTKKDKALACQKAEHEFAKMPCGIMDQFVAFMARKDNALLIDCRSMEATLIPVRHPHMSVLIINSNVKHELSASEYPLRREQCTKAAELLGKTSLRDATVDDIETLKTSGAEETVIKRARHVITEIQRTTEAAEALKKRDFDQFGKLMQESHKSLKEDFEVSCPELDALVDNVMSVPGVLGSRMTGGGFGGCTVTLLKKDAVNSVISHISSNYKGKATFYVCDPYDGAQMLKDHCCCNKK